ncbi:MAG: glycosyltransferase family 4 protein [Acidobacteria bacterium]|nr:glycosyltransferase family 4 protein [Acidobacteriota bacterium]
MNREVVIIAGKDPENQTGGHSSFVRATARAAMALGYDPHIFCAAAKGGITETDYGMIHKVRSPLKSFRQITLPLNGPLITRHLINYLKDKPGPHLIHSINAWGYIGSAVKKNLKLRGIEVVHIVNSYDTMDHEARGKLQGLRLAHGIGKWISNYAQYFWIKIVVENYERRAFTEADALLVNYDSVRRLLIDRYGADLNIHKVTYTPETEFLKNTSPDLEEIDQTGKVISALKPPNAPLIVSISRHDPRKGMDILIRALAKLNAAGVEFRACLLSGGPLLSAHTKLSEVLQLGATTIITGWVANPMHFLEKGDIFVLPSLEEGSGSVSLLEAMQAGRCIVASNIDGIPEDISDGYNGLLCSPNDDDSLAEKLTLAIQDQSLRESLGRNAHNSFELRFSADAFVKNLKIIYGQFGFH